MPNYYFITSMEDFGYFVLYAKLWISSFPSAMLQFVVTESAITWKCNLWCFHPSLNIHRLFGWQENQKLKMVWKWLMQIWPLLLCMFRENKLVVLFWFCRGIFPSFYHQLHAYYTAKRVPSINILFNTGDINDNESIPCTIRIKLNISRNVDYY